MFSYKRIIPIGLIAIGSSTLLWGQSNAYPLPPSDSDSIFIWKQKDVYDFFREQVDSNFTTVAGLHIIPFDSIAFEKDSARYRFIQTIDSLIIIYRERILYGYRYNSDGEICSGVLYYPFMNRAAIFGQFRNNRLHGIVCTFSKNGTLLDMMMYRRGTYKHHLYKEGVPCSGRAKLFKKNETSNPLRMDYLIVR
jgi:hypothetical protein